MTTSNTSLTRRSALKRWAASGIAAPFVMRAHAGVPPSETLYHASFGTSGMASNDIGALTASPHLKLVAVADVDHRNLDRLKTRFPDVKVYQDWRELLDKEKNLNSVNVSTPDHMHASITMRALQQGLHVYTQKPLTQTIYEARQLARVAREQKRVTQMGIQIHSHAIHRSIVATLQAGTIGKVKEVHSWSGKRWGDKNPAGPFRPGTRGARLEWLARRGPGAALPGALLSPGAMAETDRLRHRHLRRHGLPHPRPGLHLLGPDRPELDPIGGGAPVAGNWGLDSQVRYLFPGTRHTTATLSLCWYDGGKRPSEDVKALIGGHALSEQGSIYIGTAGILYAPYIHEPVLLPIEEFEDTELPDPGGNNHYLQFVEACRGNGQTSAPFDYSGPLTESVLLGCLATRFPDVTLEWDPANLKVTNVHEANDFVRRRYRKGWEVEGL